MKSYWWVCFLLFYRFCISCTENEGSREAMMNPDEVQMAINITTRTTNDPEVLNVNETRISRIRVYIFDGTSLDKMYYWTLTETSGFYATPVFTVKAATGKSLYAIVNEPTDMNTRAILESVDHPNDLIDVQYQIADYLTTQANVPEYMTDYCLPMYGEVKGIDVSKGMTQTRNMTVDRAVARVDVYMRKEAGNKEEVLIPNGLMVTGGAETGYVSPAKVGNYASSTIDIIREAVKSIPEETSTKDKGILAYSFYLPEMECKDRKLNLKLDGYDSIDLGGDSDNSGGAVLEKLERNHVYQLLCRFKTKMSTLDINLTVCPWIALEPNVSEIKDVHIINCYIVPPGGRVHIPTDGVYKAWAQLDEFERTPIPEGEITAEVFWQDEIGVMTEHSVKVMNASQRDKAYIVVETGAKTGNAVVAMKVNGEIYWSWHIWCTNYDPDVKGGQQEFSGHVWMDRNIGVTYNTYNKEGGIKSRGVLYQWGRKDPFSTTVGWKVNDPEQTLYDNNGEAKTVNKIRVTERNNIPNSVHQPLTFYTSSDVEIWYASHSYFSDIQNAINPYLWNSQLGKKTIFDPCPVGWRVPADIVWDKSSYERYYKLRGYGFSSIDKTIYFPCAGIRDPGTGELSGYFQYTGACWQATSVGLDSDQVACVVFEFIEWDKNATTTSMNWAGSPMSQGSGLSVRCVRE